MELKDLLELKEPSLEQYAEMERQLLAIGRDAKATIDRLDAEDRERGADRLVGRDDGGEARATERAKVKQRLDDASSVLSSVQSKASQLQARLEKEADDRAWAVVRSHLDNRVEALKKIEALCDQIGELYAEVIAEGSAALKAAPEKPDYRDGGYNNLPGRLPAQIGTAIMARLHQSVDNPFSIMAVTPDYFSDVYARNVRANGLPGFLAPIHNAIMLKGA